MGVYRACFFIARAGRAATPERNRSGNQPPILCILPLVAHQLASARDFFPARAARGRPNSQATPPHRRVWRTAISRKAGPFPPEERPPGGEPAFLAPGQREWPPTSPQRSRQQAAEDLLWIIECFANCADMIGRSTYKALDAIFNRQCEVREGKVVVKAETGGDCIQKPSDADATYDAHKGHGRGYPLSGTKETWLAPNGLWVRQERNSLGRRGTLRRAGRLHLVRRKDRG